MSLPRELSLTADGLLAMEPAREVDDAWPAERLLPASENSYPLPPEPFDLRLEGGLDRTRISAFQTGELSFEILVKNGVVSIRLPQDDGKIRYEARVEDAQDLRVVFDRGIVETFVGCGAICGTRRSYQGIQPDTLEIETEATTEVFVRNRSRGR
jgi:beta-fructofuranosidase